MAMETMEKITCNACGTRYDAFYDDFYETWDPARCPTCADRAARGLTADWALAHGPHLMRRLVALELDGDTAPDLRGLLRDERMRLQVALQRRDGQAAANAIDEIRRVAESWGIIESLGQNIR